MIEGWGTKVSAEVKLIDDCCSFERFYSIFFAILHVDVYVQYVVCACKVLKVFWVMTWGGLPMDQT